MIFKLSENESVELKYSFRSAIYFEQISGKNIDFGNFTTNDLLTLFYSVLVASLQKDKKPVITMLEMLDAIDDYNGGEKCIVEFSNWYINIIKKEYELIESTSSEENKDSVAGVQSSKKN